MPISKYRPVKHHQGEVYYHQLGSDHDDRIHGKDKKDYHYKSEDYRLAKQDYIEGKGGDDLLYGSFGGDALFGGNGDDTLYGGNGHDYVAGGLGSDRLYGGAGHDTFHFTYKDMKNGSNDTIKDFGEGDRIVIDSKSGKTLPGKDNLEDLVEYFEEDEFGYTDAYLQGGHLILRYGDQELKIENNAGAYRRYVREEGKPGTDGKPGKTVNADGADGRPGADGANGRPGADGANGANGANGRPGADGRPGRVVSADDGADGDGEVALIGNLTDGDFLF